MSPVDYQRARRHLMRADPVMAGIVKARGACGLAKRSPELLLRSLTRALIAQQLSVKAAETIFKRFLALFAEPDDSAGAVEGGGWNEGRVLASDFPPPEAIVAVPAARLREVGLSWRKAEYLHDLCRRTLDGSLPFDRLDAMSDEEVLKALTAVKGIGRWTAEMILIFQLARPDVLPVDDVGLLRAAKQVYGLRRRPDAKQFTRMGEKWRPYRSIACWYLWAELDK